VYVHCKAGRGRAASVCMAYLIRSLFVWLVCLMFVLLVCLMFSLLVWLISPGPMFV